MTPSKNIEIMAPVGCRESLSAAIQAGADSVYFGIEHLNMRARSSANFTTQDLHDIVATCREAGVKTYLTLNTVMYPEDLPLMREIVDNAKEVGLTAIIASDIAVLQYAHSVGVEVHLSTQLNIANTEALRFYAQYADVAVLARELNLEQVAKIHEDIIREHICGPKGELMRLEMFCHGALCMAVSGKCYLSLNNLGASANRGACMQVCRRGYIVKDKESDLELEVDNQYIMSPKDLKTIHFLNKMLDAGVSVLKIEGRARGPEYVQTVVGCYKEAVTAWQQGEWEKDTIDNRIEDWNNRLARVFNRGFWDGYYLGQRLGEWTRHYGSQATRTKVYAGRCTNFFKNIGVAEFYLEALPQIAEGDELLVTGETTGALELTAHDIHNGPGEQVEVIHKGEPFALKTPKPVHRGDKLFLMRQALVALLLCLSLGIEACTSLIVSGRLTPSGIPVMMKNRDTDCLNNCVMQVEPSQSGGQYTFIGLANVPTGGQSVWSGTNEMGFSIMNTAVYNLRDDSLSCQMDREGELMYRALADCRTVQEFEMLLETYPKPMGVEANFGVIDMDGGAAYFEVNNFTWTKYDVNAVPEGYMVKTNFAESGREEDIEGWERYLTAKALVDEYAHTRKASVSGGSPARKALWTHGELVNLLSRSYRHEVLGVCYTRRNAPEWVVDRDFIPRRSTSAVVVFEEGVMWTLLGYPACAPMIPTMVGNVPTYMQGDDTHTAPMCDRAMAIKNKVVFPLTRSNGQQYIHLKAVLKGERGQQSLVEQMQAIERIIDRDFRQSGMAHAEEWFSLK